MGPQEAGPWSGRPAGGQWNHGLMLIHLKYMKLSASCTSSTFLLTPHASDCWCSGRVPMSSAWILKASLISSLRLVLSLSDWIFFVSSSSLGLQYAPRLNWPVPLSSGQAVSELSALCES